MIVLLVVIIAVVVLALAIGFGGFGGFGGGVGPGYGDGPVVHRRIIRRRPPVRRIVTEEHVVDDYDPAYRR